MSYLSTIGVKFGYAVATTNGTKPTSFEWLECAKNIGGIDLTQETIDVTVLSKKIKEYAEGLADTGGSWSVTCGLGNEALTELETMISAADAAKTAGKEIWWDVWFPGLNKSFYIIATPGTKIALPEIALSSAAEIPLSLTVNRYHGLDTAVEPTKSAVD